MITPDPVVMENENGRTFEVVLGKIEKVAINTDITNEEPTQPLQNSKSNEAIDPEGECEEKWIDYKFDQKSSNKSVCYASQKGILQIEDIVYELNEHFKVGMYEIIITDVTVGLEDEFKLQPTRIDLKLTDSEAEAELAAQQVVQTKGGKKK